MREFEASVDDIPVNGADSIQFDTEGHITGFKVLRPLRATNTIH